jgi:hypothetical protein
MRKILIFLPLSALTACSSDYVANAVHSPQLDGKGEVRLGASMKSNQFSQIPSFEPYAAWAVTDHFGIMANGSFSLGSETNANGHTRRNFVEAGIGYSGKIATDFHFEFFAGYGRGNIREDNEIIPADSSRAVYGRYFAQPAVSYRTQKTAIVLAPRLTYADFESSSAGNSHFATLDPTLIFHFGKQLVFVTELGYSMRLSKGFNGHYDPLLFAIGLQYRFHRRG